MQWLGLLPDDRLLLDDGRGVLLFDLSDAPVSTLPPTHRNQPPRQDALALQLYMNAVSPPYLVHDSIRFSVLNTEGIKGLIFPLTRSASYSFDRVDLLSHPNFTSFCYLGYDSALLLAIQNPILLQFPWPEHSSSVVSQKSTIQMPSYSELLFDEYSSRLVTFGAGSSVKRILDLAAM